jgi:hypothetical protein
MGRQNQLHGTLRNNDANEWMIPVQYLLHTIYTLRVAPLQRLARKGRRGVRQRLLQIAIFTSMRFALIVAFLFSCVSAPAQKLDFLGMPDVRFGMKINELSSPQLILDTSSSYSDTAMYLRNTRCQMYYSKTQKLQLDGFSASQVEYEFCDSSLSYVFIYVSGKTEIANALAALKVDFPRMSCGKNVPLGTCTLIDTSNRQVRMILRIDQVTNEMNLVLIPKKKAG